MITRKNDQIGYE